MRYDSERLSNLGTRVSEQFLLPLLYINPGLGVRLVPRQIVEIEERVSVVTSGLAPCLQVENCDASRLSSYARLGSEAGCIRCEQQR